MGKAVAMGMSFVRTRHGREEDSIPGMQSLCSSLLASNTLFISGAADCARHLRAPAPAPTPKALVFPFFPHKHDEKSLADIC